MFSFSTLSVLATLACAVFTSAVPLDPKVPGSLPPVVVADYLTGKHGNRAGPADILTGHLGGVVPRHEGHHDGSGSGSGLLGGLVGSRHEDHDHRSLPMILLDVSAQVGPLCDKLRKSQSRLSTHAGLTFGLQKALLLLGPLSRSLHPSLMS